MCRKCIIDGGALESAATGLAIQARANAASDSLPHDDLTPEQAEKIRALSEYDCKLAKFIRGRTAYIRLARVGTDDNGQHGVYGGEYDGGYTVDPVTGITETE